ncbi:MAG: 30S ribosomal protein S12 methylthiotransferase RimO [Candidatus Gastranaerophilales bacterium]|nr:30S ribosomal protein S12 methylthiotransferase RimO [Candidatus Gastranaerophilales bacterium]
MNKIALINHGCAKNLVDSELMLGKLIQDGYQITLDETKADIVIINTCSFIHDAERESVKSIFNMIKGGKKIVITGCLAQKYKKELQSLIPEAAAFIGTSDINKISKVIKKISNNKNINYEVSDNPIYNYPENVTRQQITMGASSYIKIADGCDFNCGYCIIPQLRGSYKSRKIENIVKEAKELAKKGVNEIVLIAQDTTSYGKDIYGKPSLKELLIELNKIEDLSWIRIMYTYPSLLIEELLETINKLDKVVKYIDVPLQHVSKNMLELMNRPVMDNKKLIKKIRKLIPSVSIRTTFIAGYPNETEEDFDELCNFVQEMKIDKLGVFEFSREKNTKAYNLKPQISAKLKKERKRKLMEIQQQVSKEINEKLTGKKIECIVETVNDTNIAIGRTYKDAPEVDGIIYVKTEAPVNPGDIITVKITGAKEYDLFGSF